MRVVQIWSEARLRFDRKITSSLDPNQRAKILEHSARLPVTELSVLSHRLLRLRMETGRLSSHGSVKRDVYTNFLNDKLRYIFIV